MQEGKMKFNKSTLKSNKGFTMQDAAIAISIIFLFVGTVTAFYMQIYKLQAETKLDSVAMLFVVQIMERIDKEPYSSLEDSSKIEELVNTMQNEFSIPASFDIYIRVIPDEQTDEYVKTVELNLSYTFQGKNRDIVIRKLKVKEL